MSEWLLLSANSAIFQLYTSENRLIMVPKQSLGDILCLLRFWLWLPNEVCETYCFCSCSSSSYYYSSFFRINVVQYVSPRCLAKTLWNLVGISYAMWSSACKGWFFSKWLPCHGNGQNAKKLKNTKMIIASYSPNRNWWNLIGTTSTSSGTRKNKKIGSGWTNFAAVAMETKRGDLFFFLSISFIKLHETL